MNLSMVCQVMKTMYIFGGGQTEFTLDLPAGQHALQLVLGDYGHAPHSRQLVSDILTISVK
jgi:hypothetical protein